MLFVLWYYLKNISMDTKFYLLLCIFLGITFEIVNDSFNGLLVYQIINGFVVIQFDLNG